MELIKPIRLGLTKSNISEKLTSAEMGKLWATYMGNSMSKCILSYYLQHVEDGEIKTLLENALKLCVEFIKTTKDIFNKENFPIPIGFSEEDVNLGAPRLFEDIYYVHYLKYVCKAGMSIYNVAVPLVYRMDVKDFFVYCMDSTMALMGQINDILMNKGLIIKPPIIPVPDKVEFVHQGFLNGFLGNVRPLHALEIAHLYDNIENNTTSKALIMAFSQIVKSEKIRKLFIEGKDLTHKSIEQYMEKLHNENLPSPSFLDHLVTTSTFSPFSDKLMLFHKIDMFSMKIRAFGNSAAVNGRHDMGVLYAKSLVKISSFVEEAAKILIENGWMEQPPFAVNRDKIASEK
jgi:DNA-binding XRE family transcriptional regulator